MADHSFLEFERISQPVAHRRLFLRRLTRSSALGLALIAASLLLGMLGYRFIVGLPWLDAYENAAMILSGMGPLAQPTTAAGKLFAGTYALFSGLAVIAFAGVIFAPIVHRFLHRMHAETGPSR
jgi:hypothetical protein